MRRKAMQTAPSLPLARIGLPAEGGRRPAAARRLWSASPLTYFALVVGVLLSFYPLYYMFIIATRGLDSINDVPPPFTPGDAFGANLDRAMSAPEANLLRGLRNSLIVSSIVTVSVVLFSTLA